MFRISVCKYFVISIIGLIASLYFLITMGKESRRAWQAERAYAQTPKVAAENSKFVCYHQTIYGRYRDSPREEFYFLHDKNRKEYIVALVEIGK